MNSKGKKKRSATQRTRQNFGPHDAPESAICDLCGAQFPYVRELQLDDENALEPGILCESCRAARNEDVEHD